MFFYLKKFIAYFFEPLTITFILLGIGIYFLCRKEPNIQRGKKFVVSGTVFLFIISSSTFTYWLAAPFDSHYPAHKDLDPEANFEYIHALGSGFYENKNLPATGKMGQQALSRVIEAVRLSRLYPETKIIFSGYGGREKVSAAEVAKQAAILLGVDENRIITLEEPRDTIDESKASFKIIGDKPFLLVSSASHLTRSMGIFKKLGMNPTPAPTDFLNKGEWDLYLPSSGGIYKAERGIYEALGTAWAWITGRL